MPRARFRGVREARREPGTRPERWRGRCSSTTSSLHGVREAGLHHIFRLKTLPVELSREATRLLEPLAATTPPEAQTPWEPDSARGTIRRQLWRTTEIAGWNGWKHLAQVWLVRTQRRNPDGTTAVIEVLRRGHLRRTAATSRRPSRANDSRDARQTAPVLAISRHGCARRALPRPAADGPGAPPATPAPGRGNSGQP
jgi:hypothetical protein